MFWSDRLGFVCLIYVNRNMLRLTDASRIVEMCQGFAEKFVLNAPCHLELARGNAEVLRWTVLVLWADF